MNALYLRQELSAVSGSRVGRLALLMFVILCAWATAGGLQWYDESQDAASSPRADLLKDRQAWLSDLADVESGEDTSAYAARPMALTFLATLPPGELSPLAFRGESIQPHSALISGWRSVASLFRRYEVQGPSVLQAGRFDLAFVVLVLMPLFILIMTFDVLSAEREAGRLRMFLAQGGDVWKKLLARIAVVTALLLMIVTICSSCVAVMNSATLGEVVLWLYSCLSYGLFWAGVAGAIAVSVVRRVSGALTVLAVWSLLVVFLPSLSQFIAQAVYPLPSKVSYLSLARDTEGQTRRNLSQRAEIYMAEHPGQSTASDDAVPGFYRAAYLANIDINTNTAPLVEKLESRQRSQRQLVNMVSIVSPTLSTLSAMHYATATGSARSAEFRSQAAKHLQYLLDSIGPATVGKTRLTMKQALAIEPFQFDELSVASVVYVFLLWNSVVGVILLAIVAKRAKRVF